MVFSTDFLASSMPPPQSVLDQSWLWKLLLFLLGVTFLLRLIGLDIAGSLLSGLMLCVAGVMMRDGMRELGKYALVYAVLCGLNFFFDILPLITELGGRVSRTKEPVGATTDQDGIQQTTYVLTTKVTPFFDGKQGVVYNVQSLAMIISPITMALGIYLAVSAHSEIQRHVPILFEQQDFGAYSSQSAGTQQASSRPSEAASHRIFGMDGPAASGSNGAAANTSSAGASSAEGNGTGVGHQPRARTPPENFGRFQGQCYKLG
mmetsp:Transcript_141597/g.394706  ORF Transcript_141597/g.394706 Transcript_141597/m.394706 type:complete len:262 (-) Transcript_141597:82-867(-)